MNQYVKQYQQASIETASREQILIMLYDGAIQFLNKAKIAMQNKNIEEQNNNLIAAQNIIQEFINSLDHEIAPQLAQNLQSLYEYFLRRLIFANIKRKIEPIDEVLKYLKSLKMTWEKAIRMAQAEAESKETVASNGDDYYDSVSDNDDDDEEDDEDDEE